MKKARCNHMLRFTISVFIFLTGILTACDGEVSARREDDLYLVVNNVPPAWLTKSDNGQQENVITVVDDNEQPLPAAVYGNLSSGRLIVLPQDWQGRDRFTVKFPDRDVVFDKSEQERWRPLDKKIVKGINSAGSCAYLDGLDYFEDGYFRLIAYQIISQFSGTAYAFSVENTCVVTFTNAWETNL